MYEIVYSIYYGGIHITKEMVEYMSKLGSKKSKKLLRKEDKIYYDDWEDDKYRYDPYLVQMVKDLKPKRIKIKKIKSNKFIIVEYDGLEDVISFDKIKWHTIKK